MNQPISRHIFRAYDIRGVYKQDISPDVFYKIGLAAGTYVKQKIQGTQIIIGNDIRQSSPSLSHAFIAGVTAVGVHIQYTGTTSFGQTLFTGNHHHADLIAFVTASHLPPDWNGIKFYYSDGVGFSEENLMTIRDLVIQESYELAPWNYIGQVTTIDAKIGYKKFFNSQFNFKKKLKITLDCGGASMTLSAPEILKTFGFDVVPVFCELDPTFSKRPSDPKPKNLTTLVETIKKTNSDFGVAFDGDGDRAVIVDNTGQILTADQTGIILGKFGFETKKGIIIVNVECSKSVKEQLESLGYTIKQIPVGHTFLTLEAKKTHAILGIESSGHLIIPEYFLFDDAMIVPLKIAQILDNIKNSLHDLVIEIPSYPTIKEEIECADEIKFEVITQLKKKLLREYKQLNTLDGIRIDFKNGWVLIRASNTSPIIRLTIEANTHSILKELTIEFKTKTNEVIEQINKLVK